MKKWLVDNKDMITNVAGAIPATIVAGYQTYGMVQGQGGNGTQIALACVLAFISYMSGKK